jgi:hypothetical protein
VETVGYVGRALGHHDKWSLNYFLIQSILLLVAPALFAASIYMVLGRIILRVHGTQFSLIRPSRLTKIFVLGDVFAFLVQSSGAGLMSSAGKLKAGQNIVLGGLIIQIAWFAFFVVVAGIFQKRAAAHAASNRDHPLSKLPWQKHLMALYASSALILVRSVVRVVEYAMGNSGYIMRHEAFVYVFDALLMWSVMVIFLVIFPTQLLGQGKKDEMEKLEGGMGVISESRNSDAPLRDARQ